MPVFTSSIEVTADYPTIKPSLNLNFARSRALDPRITFTRASTATYVGRDGLIKTAGDDEARFDHDPDTLESLGLLIEESRTNNITQSNASNWSNTNLTRGSNTAQDVSPEGLNTATIITETTGNGLHRIKSPQISFSDTRTFSIWIKRNSGTRDLYINANAIMNAGLNFDFDTETLGSTTGTVSFERYSNEWYRFILTGTGTGGTNGVYIQFTQSGNENDDNYVGDTSNSFLMWGAQLEVGSFVTSHIPTSGSAVTRAVDYGQITGDSFTNFFNSTEGTYKTKVRINGYKSAGYPRPFVFAELADIANDFWQLVVNNSSQNFFAETRVNAGTPSSNSAASVAPNTDFIATSAVKNGEGMTSYYGNTLRTNVGASLSSTLDSLVFNHSSYNGTISELVYYPKALTDAQLQQLTL